MSNKSNVFEKNPKNIKIWYKWGKWHSFNVEQNGELVWNVSFLTFLDPPNYPIWWLIIKRYTWETSILCFYDHTDWSFILDDWTSIWKSVSYENMHNCLLCAMCQFVHDQSSNVLADRPIREIIKPACVPYVDFSMTIKCLGWQCIASKRSVIQNRQSIVPLTRRFVTKSFWFTW